MENLKKYFTIGTEEWKTTVKYCFKLGQVVGLFVGLVLVLKVL